MFRTDAHRNLQWRERERQEQDAYRSGFLHCFIALASVALVVSLIL